MEAKVNGILYTIADWDDWADEMVRVDLEIVNEDEISDDVPAAMEMYLAVDSDAAGEAAREYWEDLAESDPDEFCCLVGKDTLIAWALGHGAGPGSTKVSSLEEWLDLWLDTPEEHFASYDGEEKYVELCDDAAEEFFGCGVGAEPNECVGYRCG